MNMIVFHTNKEEMVVLSNEKQGKFNYHNEWQDLSGRQESLTHSEIWHIKYCE